MKARVRDINFRLSWLFFFFYFFLIYLKSKRDQTKKFKKIAEEMNHTIERVKAAAEKKLQVNKMYK